MDLNKRNVGIIAGVTVVGVLGALVLFGAFGGKPYFNIDIGMTDDGGDTSDPRRVGLKMNYDTKIYYNDGSTEQFTKNFYAPDLKFQLLSAINTGSGTTAKSVSSIVVTALAELDLPDDTHGMGNTFLTKSKADIMLNETKIGSISNNATVALSDGRKPIELYRININGAQISNVKDGRYQLVFKTHDEMIFTVNGVSRAIISDATPSLMYRDTNHVLSNFVVTTASATANYGISKIPVYYVSGDYKELISYKYYLTVTAKNFKPNANVLFNYTHPSAAIYAYSYCSSTTCKNNWDGTVTSDQSGTAVHQVLVANKYSDLKCYQYYIPNLTVTDGVNKATTKIGCSYSEYTN